MNKKKKNNQLINPKVRTVLELIAAGTMLSSLFIFPGAAIGIDAILKMYKKAQREKDFKKWDKFNLSRLRSLLKRLHKQKVITISEKDGYTTIKLTKKGKLRVFNYKLADMEIEKPKKWDKKWRLIIYDISRFKKRQQSAFRRMLKKLEMLPLQKSVYLTPYSCNKEIEFLREYFNVGEDVIYIVANSIENEYLYKRYFGI